MSSTEGTLGGWPQVSAECARHRESPMGRPVNQARESNPHQRRPWLVVVVAPLYAELFLTKVHVYSFPKVGSIQLTWVRFASRAPRRWRRCMGEKSPLHVSFLDPFTARVAAFTSLCLYARRAWRARDLTSRPLWCARSGCTFPTPHVGYAPVSCRTFSRPSCGSVGHRHNCM